MLLCARPRGNVKGTYVIYKENYSGYILNNISFALISLSFIEMCVFILLDFIWYFHIWPIFGNTTYIYLFVVLAS